MILLLTYHKVLPATAGDADFYTITPEQLRQQIQALNRAGFLQLAPADLLEMKTSSERAFLLSFDDATSDHLQVVLPILDESKCRGLFFVPTQKLDMPGRLDSEQVSMIANAGHVVGCHSHEHRRMDTMNRAEVSEQLAMSTRILNALTGAMPVFFAPPGGYMNRTVQEIATEWGLRAIRTMRWGYNRVLDLKALECIPVHRHLDDRKFQAVLGGRNPYFLYAAKEAVKSIAPIKVYEVIRRLFFGAAGRK